MSEVDNRTLALLQKVSQASYAAEGREGEVRETLFRKAADLCKEALDIEHLRPNLRSYFEGQRVACLCHACDFESAAREGAEFIAAGSEESQQNHNRITTG